MKNESVSRKKFLAWGLTIPAFLAIPAFLRRSPRLKAEKTVKMLSQDGKLVTIRVEDIPKKKKKIKTEDIHNWISKK